MSRRLAPCAAALACLVSAGAVPPEQPNAKKGEWTGDLAWRPVENDTAPAGTWRLSPPTAGTQRVPRTDATFSTDCYGPEGFLGSVVDDGNGAPGSVPWLGG